eukprot:sb/3471420/
MSDDHCLFSQTTLVNYHSFMDDVLFSYLQLSRATSNLLTSSPRWFAIVYLLLVFLLLPLSLLGLSLISTVLLLAVVGFVFLVVLFIVTLNLIQTHAPHWLPPMLKSWYFLPEWMRSLRPLDRVISAVLGRLPCCKSLANITPTEPTPPVEDVNHPNKNGQNTENGGQTNDIEKKTAVIDRTTTI